ncbi:hypothetical protein HCM42_002454 [Salmonella enterica subsp. enterica]|uniref:Uncharacterized protein n=1 Tax=Salmonella enterica subsp. houtenae serovar 45:g,z51:- TaxID=1967611 RepID=A0A736RK23_SALHO|nr:hypothetical protein [Salmonella enterica subsp. enterica serovar Poona]EHC5871961.1 hypothetical protein [Salmonella enterica subsp. enterica serovar Eastbourne]EHL8494093.1 hypothetical protein [Salmonella enterica]HAE7766843.1 hypothetical protein [Salmonella enterica subsp. houtenae serovar 45:g,z51:-]EHC5907855.1 hypothetical protein [Salmonella enterica subsp. enterica serovar Eastbourne]
MSDINEQVADIKNRASQAENLATYAILNTGDIDSALSVIYLATRILEDAKYQRDTA